MRMQRGLLILRSKSDSACRSSQTVILQGASIHPLHCPRRVLIENFDELLHVVHRPTVQLACHKYNLMFKSVPRALFITLEDRGRVFRWGSAGPPGVDLHPTV